MVCSDHERSASTAAKVACPRCLCVGPCSASSPGCAVKAKLAPGESRRDHPLMSKVVYWMTVSLDGFVETSDGKIDWTAPDAELPRFLNESARKLGAFLHGRRMYEGMASVWPTAEQNASFSEDLREFGRIWMLTPKVVFSKTLGH